ncbi:unnamed protein product [Schistosoma curassoni]|uniref:Usp domain-containing protein n=1 Tax=Schistosoma curassoni TaxID=6186 RepID=A0A183JBR3_9TREM|nr:unnamed protein product [Schistosoma curassoni]VDO59711.1 unnamed protein product [Schistosoma curassoni]
MTGSNSPKTTKVLRKVLIPLDNSNESKKALDWYQENMKRDGDLVIFVHVLDPIQPSALSALSYECESMPAGSSFHVPEEILKSARYLCQEMVHKATKYGIKSEGLIQIDNKPGPALVKTINERKINAVVMSKRGLGFWKLNFTPNVTSYVLHHSNIPVSIIPPSNR